MSCKLTDMRNLSLKLGDNKFILSFFKFLSETAKSLIEHETFI